MIDTADFVVESLIESGQISPDDARAAAEHASESDCDVCAAMIELEMISHRDLAICRAKLCEYPFVDLTSFEIDIKNATLLPKSLAQQLVVFPLFIFDGVATVAVLDPLNLDTIDRVHQVLRCDVDPVLCDEDLLRTLIAKAYSLIHDDAEAAAENESAESNRLTTGDEPVVAAVNQVIAGAADAAASDVHLSPDEVGLHLRYRIDGVLVPQQGPPKSMHSGLTQRLKVLASLDVTQTRRPQDGKFRYIHRGKPIDIRLSLVPTVHGENVVMRLLRPAAAIGKISELGMPPDVEPAFERLIQRPHGMVLVCGPTGSGKTTTLYTALNHINRPEVNIMTAEDPVEIRLPLIRQVQVNAEIGLDFASSLRSFLRQDPDVILVGEIRDAETARIGAQAALTGHLVFSTVHTNDACGSIARLRDLGVPPFAINNALLAALAQRLVRRVCARCSGQDESAEHLATAMGLDAKDASLFVRGTGCGRCLSTGYRGRIGAYELLQVTPAVQEVIEADRGGKAIRAVAQAEG
ncbi:MAG: GspE/PulE family protein, partial [Planctomycetota bacterium]